MPVRRSIIHQIDKKPYGSHVVLHVRDTELAESQTIQNLLHDLSVAYNAKIDEPMYLNELSDLIDEEQPAANYVLIHIKDVRPVCRNAIR